MHAEAQSGAEWSGEESEVASRSEKRPRVGSRRTVRRTASRAESAADSEACSRVPDRLPSYMGADWQQRAAGAVSGRGTSSGQERPNKSLSGGRRGAKPPALTTSDAIGTSAEIPTRVAWRLANEDALAPVEPLGKNVSRVSPNRGAVDPEELAKRRRARRYHLRTVAQSMSQHTSVQKCGRVRHGDGSVEVRVSSRGAYFAGLVHCGSVWECPVCMQGIAAGRVEEIRRALDRHRAAGGSAFMLTLTLPHDSGDRLRPMRRHVARAWRYVQTGAPWKRMKERIGFVGSIRSLEVTAGVHGWHPHLHVLLFTSSRVGQEVLDEFLEFVYRRWRDAITRKNPDNGQLYRAPDFQHGISLTESHSDDYLAKFGLADELARSPAFEGGSHGRASHSNANPPVTLVTGRRVKSGTWLLRKESPRRCTKRGN